MKRDVAVVILAGGEGRRIGGEKPVRMLGDERLIDRAAVLAGQWSDVIAVALRDPSQVPSLEITVIEDQPDVPGPLGGLIAGLKFARDHDRRLLLSMPSDMPFLPADLRERLARSIGVHGAALASSGGQVHPVCALWRTSSLDRVHEYVLRGRRSLKGFAETIGCVEVEWPTDPNDPFFNINSSAELAEAARRAKL